MAKAAHLMAVPLATTTITAQHAREDEPGEGRTFTTYARRISAHLSAPAGTEEGAPGGGSSTVTNDLLCDPIDLRATDRIVDDSTGLLYEVDWVKPRSGLGLDHVKAGVHRTEGIVPS